MPVELGDVRGDRARRPGGARAGRSVGLDALFRGGRGRADLPRHLADVPRHLTDLAGHLADVPRHLTNLPRHLANIPRHLADVPRHVIGSWDGI